MTEKQRLQACLIRTLTTIGFDDRYYDYVALLNSRLGGPAQRLGKEEFLTALSATGMEFTYDSKEKFFKYAGNGAEYELGVNAIFTDATLELVLFVKMSGTVTGGPFALLARAARQLTNRPLPPGAPYPKLPFHDRATLEEAVRLGISLFQDVRATLHSNPAWPTC